MTSGRMLSIWRAAFLSASMLIVVGTILAWFAGQAAETRASLGDARAKLATKNNERRTGMHELQQDLVGRTASPRGENTNWAHGEIVAAFVDSTSRNRPYIRVAVRTPAGTIECELESISVDPRNP